MFKKKFKNLLCYCATFSLLICNVLSIPIVAGAASTPNIPTTLNSMTVGEKTIELKLTPNEPFVIDTRCNYKIKKSELIEYCKASIERLGVKICEEDYYDGLGNVVYNYEFANDVNDIDWDSIENFGLHTTKISYGGNETYKFKENIAFSEDGEYLIIPALSDGNTYNVYINNANSLRGNDVGGYNRSPLRFYYDKTNNTL